MCPVVCAMCAAGEDRHSFEHVLEGGLGCAAFTEREYVVACTAGRFHRHFLDLRSRSAEAICP